MGCLCRGPTHFNGRVISVTRRSRSDESHLLTHSLSHSLSVSIDFTDVTLVSDDTFRRNCLVMKVV